MNMKISFDKLIAAARQESAPGVDIAGAVLNTLSLAQPSEVISYKPLAWIASASGAIAASVAVAAILYMRYSATNSMSDIYQVISWAGQ
jgi:hypothetical protein